MKRIVALVIPLLVLINVALAQKSNILKSDVKFQLKNLGVNTGGTFKTLQATINFDADKPETGTIEATLDVNSVNTDNDLRDNHLRSDEFFDATKYPSIVMKSISIKHKGGDKYVGQFNLTIKNQTKQFEMPFTYDTDATSATFKGGLKLNRLDFGVGGKSLVMSNEVSVSIEVQVAK
ncbi:YceI family protein [Mucilaginibacter sp. dw_454]|uniref:YceI family protein n=1 Tax=Mucilaginibacter sp. dw_454 TaxID=2720079 RepID=UPI001BD2BEEF|nr:YceI family protein [Mucilaginibacter sp. dw_454]